jgi:glucose-1-phosphate cytidylyltransferase
MKVVLFCGGLGTRIREHSERIPKPLVNVGNRPILWHLMRYYAHFGHKDFILCLGYGGEQIREFFLNYNECLSNDFVLSPGRKNVELLARDVQDWRITFVDTGLHSSVGERLLRVRQFVQGESTFLANYSDGLSDLPLDQYIADFESRSVIASLLAVPPPVSFHSIRSDSGGLVTGFGPMRDAGLLINGGFFCLRPEIFDYLQRGEDLIEAFQRLSARRQLRAFRYDGFWQAMDTFKDKMAFDRMHARGECPWMLWKQDELEKKQPTSRSGVRAAKAAYALVRESQEPLTSY